MKTGSHHDSEADHTEPGHRRAFRLIMEYDELTFFEWNGEDEDDDEEEEKMVVDD
jgi:hypothetical protein